MFGFLLNLKAELGIESVHKFTSDELVVETINLKKIFFPRKHSVSLSEESERINALNGISVSIKQGEVIGITGANGSGKSTFLKILARTLSPSSGFVSIKGKIIGVLNGSGGFQAI